jgi:hypothetical protein
VDTAGGPVVTSAADKNDCEQLSMYDTSNNLNSNERLPSALQDDSGADRIVASSGDRTIRIADGADGRTILPRLHQICTKAL